jgi:hypothetical protein
MYYNWANFPWQEYYADHTAEGCPDDIAYDAYNWAWGHYYFSAHTWLSNADGGQVTYPTLAAFPWQAYAEHCPGLSDAAAYYEHYKTYYPRWIKEPAGSDYTWKTLYSKGVPSSFKSCFFIPKHGDGEVDIVVRGMNGASIAGHSKIRIRYRLETSPGTWFVGADGGGAGRLALYFQRSKDDYGSKKYARGYRCWSKVRSKLVAGENTLEADLTSYTYWAPGELSASEFNATKADLMNLGFTFGGSQNAGHGVYCTDGNGGGWAKFTLLEYSLL